MSKLCFFFLFVLSASGCGLVSPGSPSGTLTASGLLVGERVALSGDAAILGAPGSNEAFAFARAGEGWALAADLRPSDTGGPDPFYGQFLDLHGEIAVIGAPETDSRSDAPGRAHVYERSGGAWPEVAVLRPEDLGPSAKFGNAVTVSNRRIAVSSDDVSGGRVHVFEKVQGTWARTAVLTPPDTGEGESVFSGSVVLDADRLAVNGRTGPILRDRRVYMYERESTGVWALTDVIEAPAESSNNFGLDMALDGPTLVAYGSSLEGGSVHVYRESAAGWALETTLSRSREEIGSFALFGFRLALSGDRLVAAAAGRVVDGESLGAAFVYVRGSNGTWSQEAELRPSERVIGFGRDVAIDGETVLVGANNTEDKGGGYLFRKGSGGWEEVR